MQYKHALGLLLFAVLVSLLLMLGHPWVGPAFIAVWSFILAVFFGTGAGIIWQNTGLFWKGTGCRPAEVLPPNWRPYARECGRVVTIQAVAWSLCEVGLGGFEDAISRSSLESLCASSLSRVVVVAPFTLFGFPFVLPSRVHSRSRSHLLFPSMYPPSMSPFALFTISKLKRNDPTYDAFVVRTTRFFLFAFTSVPILLPLVIHEYHTHFPTLKAQTLTTLLYDIDIIQSQIYPSLFAPSVSVVPWVSCSSFFGYCHADSETETHFEVLLRVGGSSAIDEDGGIVDIAIQKAYGDEAARSATVQEDQDAAKRRQGGEERFWECTQFMGAISSSVPGSMPSAELRLRCRFSTFFLGVTVGNSTVFILANRRLRMRLLPMKPGTFWWHIAFSLDATYQYKIAVADGDATVYTVRTHAVTSTSENMAIPSSPHPAPTMPNINRTSTEEIISGVRSGSSFSVEALVPLIQPNYAKHGASILDALLTNLKLPENKAFNELALDFMTAGMLSMSALREVNRWLARNQHTPVAVSTSLRLLSDADGYIRWATEFMRATGKPTNKTELILTGYHITANFFYTLVSTPTDILKTLCTRDALLDLAISWWIATCEGAPIMYGDGILPGPAPADSGAAVFCELTTENPRGMAEAIMLGRVCSPALFVQRTIVRVRCMVKLKAYKHLRESSAKVAHARENFRAWLHVTLYLRECSSTLRDRFRKAKIAVVLMETLHDLARASLEHGISAGESREARAACLVDILRLIYQWVTWTPFETISNVKTILGCGFMNPLAECLVILNRDGSKVALLMKSLIAYTTYPEVLEALLPSLASRIQPAIRHLIPNSYEHSYFIALESGLQPLSQAIVVDNQECLCDNLMHVVRLEAAGIPHPELACSGCHSVVYCSKRCQIEDWNALHRRECAKMRSLYFENKSLQKHYPHRYRKYHTTLTRRFYETGEVIRRTITYTQNKWREYDPCNVTQSIIIFPEDEDQAPGWGTDLDTYVFRTVHEQKVIPPYLLPRFEAYVSVFRRTIALARQKPATPLHRRRGPGKFSIPNDSPGSIRFAERAFRWGDREKVVVLLMEQLREVPVYTAPFPLLAEAKALESARERAWSSPIFKIHASFVYECSYRSFTLIIEGAKAGSLPHLRQLRARIAKEYPEYGLQMLEAVLCNLKEPSSEEDEDDARAIAERTALTVVSVASLKGIALWLGSQKVRTPVSISSSLLLFSSAKDYAARILQLLTTATTESTLLEVHHDVTCLFRVLLDANPRLLPTLAQLPSMLDIAIAYWTTQYRGFPVLYPGGLPTDVPLIAESGDLGLWLFDRLTAENPGGMAEAVMDGRICEPKIFVKRMVERMSSMAPIQQVPNLANVKGWTVEVANAGYCVHSMDQVCEKEVRILKLLMATSRYPEKMVQALGRMSTRLDERKLSDDAQELKRHTEHLMEILELSQHVVNWVARTSTNVVRNMRRLMDSGAILIVSHYITHIADQQHHTVDDILRTIIPYALYPLNLRMYVSAVSTLVSPRLSKTPDTSYRKSAVGTAVMSLVPLRDYIQRGTQIIICDNLKHREGSRRGDGKVVPSEKVCGACRSVTYCSKKCQAEDWTAFHRAECGEMLRVYLEQQGSGMVYPRRYRRFHSSILCHAFEMHEVGQTSIGSHLAKADFHLSYDPTKVQVSIGISHMDPDVMANQGMTLSDYVAKTTPYIPEYKKRRFNALISTFRSWGIRAKLSLRNSQSATSLAGVTSLRLIERAFRFGEIDIVLVLLLEQTKRLPVLTGALIEVSEKLEAIRQRPAADGFSFDVIGSLEYTT
ncbi:hypothetical protein NMY22_g8272 [Coprinellus aureogranulatus]|nr:hypothetical protein NMY22_g8272 [Coprinellus aureogranulatus]